MNKRRLLDWSQLPFNVDGIDFEQYDVRYNEVGAYNEFAVPLSVHTNLNPPRLQVQFIRSNKTTNLIDIIDDFSSAMGNIGGFAVVIWEVLRIMLMGF